MKFLKKITEMFDMNMSDMTINKDEIKNIVSDKKFDKAQYSKKPNVGDMKLKYLQSKKYELDNSISTSIVLSEILHKKLPLLKNFELINTSDSTSFSNIKFGFHKNRIHIYFSLKMVKDNFILEYESMLDKNIITKYSMFETFHKSELNNYLDKVNRNMILFELYIEDEIGERIF